MNISHTLLLLQLTAILLILTLGTSGLLTRHFEEYVNHSKFRLIAQS